MTKTNEEKIDFRKHYILMIDTETANTITEPVLNEQGETISSRLIMDYPLFYDLGYAVIDTHGNIYEMGSYVNKDIFYDMEDLMQSAYYAEKIPLYHAELEMGIRKESTTIGLKRIIAKVVKKYHITHICAHNHRFDLTAVNGTLRYITKSKYRYFYPCGMELWDSLKMAKSVMGKMPSYVKFCQKNGYLTKRGDCRFTAEVLYRFISRNRAFEEHHMGLDDVMIESAIVAYCFKQHKKMEKDLFKKKKAVIDD